MALKARTVVVGIGSIGKRHARLLAQRGDLAIEWCEPNAQILADALIELGEPSRVHHDFDAMIATSPRIVVIATPHRFHAEQTIKAMRAGAHVLCEKPMSDSPEAARQMVAASKNSDQILAIGFHLHFHPALRRLTELIRSSLLGTIAHVHCRVGSYVTLANSRTRYQHALEGALMLDYAHQPDLLHWMLREIPVGVYAAGAHLDSMDLHSNPNVLSLNFDYARPLLGTIHLNYLQAPERHEYEIVGSDGWAALDMATSELKSALRSRSSPLVETFKFARDSLYIAEHQSFIDAINGKCSPESTADDALASVLMAAASFSSWKAQKRVRLDSV
jgi:predicted dehydrogenase